MTPRRRALLQQMELVYRSGPSPAASLDPAHGFQDPTKGLVDYLSESEATAQHLAYVNHRGNVVLAVDSTTDLVAGQNRSSVRLESKATFVKGQLVLLDAVHMPTGCATWPAFWTYAPDWPCVARCSLSPNYSE